MKPLPECASCLLEWVYDRAKANLTQDERFDLARDILLVMGREFLSSSNLGLISNRITDKVSGAVSKASSHYHQFKRDSNRVAKQMLPDALRYVRQGKTRSERFERAVALATVGNVAPIRRPSQAFTFQDAADLMTGTPPPLSIEEGLFNIIKGSSRILYLTDNAGEIGFDSLLISEIKDTGAHVSLVVKDPSFFEDATLDDVHFFSLDNMVDDLFIINGFFVPSQCNGQLAEELTKSDLVIAKGTGNYEGCGGELSGKPCIHLLKVKCRPIANQLQAESGDFVAKYNAPR
jgi:damage-control phosphatase, subfamily I